jgi:hypothetical protein
LVKEGIDDRDKSASYCDRAFPRRSTSSSGAKLKPAYFAAIIGTLISQIAGKLEPLRTVATAPVAPGKKIFQGILGLTARRGILMHCIAQE